MHPGGGFWGGAFFFERGGCASAQIFKVGDVLVHDAGAPGGQGAVSGDEPAAREFFEPGKLPPPVAQVGLSGGGVGAVGDEIAREEDFLLGHPDHRVAPGVAVADADDLKQSPAVADLQPILEGDHRRVELKIGRKMAKMKPALVQRGGPAALFQLALHLLPDEIGADRDRPPSGVIAVVRGVVEVVMGVENKARVFPGDAAHSF